MALRKTIQSTVGAMLLLGVAALACGSKEGKVQREYATVEARDLRVTVTATGTIKPLREVRLKSKAGGRVMEIRVPTGSPVKMGDILILLDPEEERLRLEQASSARAAAESRLAAAQARLGDLERRLADSDRLAQKNLAPKEESLGLKAQVLAARAERDGAQAALRQAEAALEESTLRFNDTTLRAPMDGVLLDRFVEIGSVVSSGVTGLGGGADVALVGDLSQFRVIAEVDEADFGRIAMDQAVEVKLDAFPDRPLKGRISALPGRGRRETGASGALFDCEALLDPAPEVNLRPEMTALATIEIARIDKAPTLPLAALSYAGDGWQVKREKPDGEGLEDRPVRIGQDDGKFAQILEGLALGDKVVIFNQTEREREERILKKRKQMMGP